MHLYESLIFAVTRAPRNNVTCTSETAIINSMHAGKFFMILISADAFRASNSLDPDQDQHYVCPDLDPNCLQRISADDKSLMARKEITLCMLGNCS